MQNDNLEIVLGRLAVGVTNTDEIRNNENI